MKMYEEYGEWKIPLISLPLGMSNINIMLNKKSNDEIFIFLKYRNIALYEYIAKVLYYTNYKVNFIKYPTHNESFDEKEFIKIIKSCKFGIWIGSHETFRYEYLEVLNNDIPLLVIDVKSMKQECNEDNYRIHTNKNLFATSIPYWSEKCGEVLYDILEFEDKLKTIENGILCNKYNPKKFIIDNMNPSTCLINILTKFDFIL